MKQHYQNVVEQKAHRYPQQVQGMEKISNIKLNEYIKYQPDVANNLVGLTPEGVIPQKDKSANSFENPTPSGDHPFERRQGILGPIPTPLTEEEKLKLRLSLKIGLFYYQYSLLKK
jgi:hypothetical protein